MSWLSRLTNVFRSSRVNRDLDDELLFHIEARTGELVRRGMTREQASLALDLAQQRYNLGLSSIVEFSQAELGKTEADIADTAARYQYRLTQIVLAYTTGEPR